MGLFKKTNPKLVELQNIVLGLNEKKLQVSEEFLMEMTGIYVSKRMSIVNKLVSCFTTSTNIEIFDKRYDAALKLLDKLAEIEPLYEYSNPVPSEYKAQLVSKKTAFINQLINRDWRIICNTYAGLTQDESAITLFFATYMNNKHLMTEESLNYLNEIHVKARGYGINEEPPAEPINSSSTDEANTENE